MCAVMRSSPDSYAALHLAPQATAAEVRRTYRSQLLRHHPDTRPAWATRGVAATEHEILTLIIDAHGTGLLDAPHGSPSIIAGPLRWEPPRQGGIFR